MGVNLRIDVIPAKAGIQSNTLKLFKSSIYLALRWIPAFAGMTSERLI
ncbi:hypothetical protein RMAECT_1031 [Rickettsia rhipicephali str. Ect]|uniref:Uncharacterized protein n=1 Tax=Rickettsia rhipicephali str. Ect TaxID=1359199 RepID=A0A0F3PHC0_RICRH|nr:hypothetical protein RMAECT_1031 [Rickettsia rhipicephali str. Ect]